MAARSLPHKARGWWIVLLIAAALAIQVYNGSDPGRGKVRPPPPARQAGTERQGGYEVHRGCTLVDARGNDGDSFLVRLPSGRQAMFRLYFVDTPESAFRSYANGENNHRRISEQARAFGISPEQAVEVGRAAKHFTLELLASHPFDLHTRWDSPFHDERYHAFIDVSKTAGSSRWLDEILVEKGYVRIHTKGAEMPDGTSQAMHEAKLRSLENAAKKARAGAWALAR